MGKMSMSNQQIAKDIVTFAHNFVSDKGLLPILNNKHVIVPGLCDVHVHFREPGFSYKETIKSGSSAAARGGYTAVCTMPNLNPPPDCLENLSKQLEIIESDSVIDVIPYGCITVSQKGEELSDMQNMRDRVCAFSDDGKGVQDPLIMERAQLAAKEVDKIIAAHCEDNSLLFNGYIHDGEYAKKYNHLGISSASEYKQIERDIQIAKKTGCKYHVCHISTKESVELIRHAKRDGIDITCETAPHYLVLSDDDLIEDGRFKMNPPIRSLNDKKALIDGILDGTIDMIATDHAPHSIEEKARGLKNSAMGVVGLETAFPVLYTELVMRGILSIEKLIELMCFNPRRRFGIDINNDFAIFEVETPYKITPSEFISKGRATPFENRLVYGRCVLTVHNNKVVYMCK